MNGKLITIVGGTGFLGTQVIKQLANKGYTLRVIARNPELNLQVKTSGDVGQIKMVSADVARPESLKGQFAGSYAVINLVGILFEKGRQKFDVVHTQGAEHIAKLAKQAGASKFIQISSLSANTASPSKYAKSKGKGEELVKAAFPQATIFRPSIIFGTDDNFFNKFATMASFAPFLPLMGGGKTNFQPVFVLDVAEAIVAAVENDALAGQTFELGGPQTFTFRELLEFISKTIHRKITFIPLPYGIAGLIGCFASLLPNPPLTSDQVTLLKYDCVVSNGAKTLKDINISPESIGVIVPPYLARFARRLA